MAEQLGLVSAILGGFSFTFIGSLLSRNDERKIVDYTFLVAIISAILFFICALGWALIAGSPSAEDMAPALKGIHRLLSQLFLGGILVLTMCLGMSGWIRSKKVGIGTTIIAFIGFWFIVSVVRGFIN